MADPYFDLEASVQSSDPRELVRIQLNPPAGQIWTHTSGSEDIEYGGEVYSAIAVDRDETSIIMPSARETECSVLLPVDHELVRRYFRQGIPPRQVSVTIYRQQPGYTETIWRGYGTSLSVDKEIARLLVPSQAGTWMLRPIPSMTISAQCPHILYSAMCGVSRTGSGPGGLAHKVSATAISVVGRDVRVDLGTTDRNGSWAEGGELYHPASGERMTIAAQIDANPGISAVATLSLQVQMVGLKAGDAVEVFAGCDHSINGTNGCSPKFGNRGNYGGEPQLTDADIFVPGSYGERLIG